MMWIVKIALRAPYTFTVLAVLLLIGGALSTLQMAKDIFPAINIPVVGDYLDLQWTARTGNGPANHDCIRASFNDKRQ